MKTSLRLLIALQAVLVAALGVAVAGKRIPLGIPGEWEWLRPHSLPHPGWLAVVFAFVVGYGCLAAVGLRALSRPLAVSRLSEGVWVALLLVASILIQVLIPTAAADEYDLTKWAYVNYFGASTGYYKVAREQALSDPWKFLAEYPVWIQSQDSLHIGTHPPGLIAMECLLIRTMERHPAVADALLRFMPWSTDAGFRQLEKMDRKPIPRADRAALYAASLITLLACAGTVVPLYSLARSTLSAPAAWAAAAFWPLVPAANLFQPDADAAYPFLSTLALALAAWPVKRRGVTLPAILALACGVALAFGTFFSLAFLPVGLIVALVVASAPTVSARRKGALILAIGVGFVSLIALAWSLTGANPVTVWTWNLKNHARFYVEYPRTYLAWLAVNPIELAVALGLPAVVWCVCGLVAPRSVPRAAWATIAVLVVLNLTGRNMGEVARLWMLFLPPLLLATGAGLTRLGGGPSALGSSAVLLGIQTLALQTMVQVVYPV